MVIMDKEYEGIRLEQDGSPSYLKHGNVHVNGTLHNSTNHLLNNISQAGSSIAHRVVEIPGDIVMIKERIVNKSYFVLGEDGNTEIDELGRLSDQKSISYDQVIRRPIGIKDNDTGLEPCAPTRPNRFRSLSSPSVPIKAPGSNERERLRPVSPMYSEAKAMLEIVREQEREAALQRSAAGTMILISNDCEGYDEELAYIPNVARPRSSPSTSPSLSPKPTVPPRSPISLQQSGSTTNISPKPPIAPRSLLSVQSIQKQQHRQLSSSSPKIVNHRHSPQPGGESPVPSPMGSPMSKSRSSSNVPIVRSSHPTAFQLELKASLQNKVTGKREQYEKRRLATVVPADEPTSNNVKLVILFPGGERIPRCFDRSTKITALRDFVEYLVYNETGLLGGQFEREPHRIVDYSIVYTLEETKIKISNFNNTFNDVGFTGSAKIINISIV
eukprot:gene15203-17989_t